MLPEKRKNVKRPTPHTPTGEQPPTTCGLPPRVKDPESGKFVPGRCPHSGLTAYQLRQLVMSGELKAGVLGRQLIFYITDLQFLKTDSIDNNRGRDYLLRQHREAEKAAAHAVDSLLDVEISLDALLDKD